METLAKPPLGGGGEGDAAGEGVDAVDAEGGGDGTGIDEGTGAGDGAVEGDVAGPGVFDGEAVSEVDGAVDGDGGAAVLFDEGVRAGELEGGGGVDSELCGVAGGEGLVEGDAVEGPEGAGGVEGGVAE